VARALGDLGLGSVSGGTGGGKHDSEQAKQSGGPAKKWSIDLNNIMTSVGLKV